MVELKAAEVVQLVLEGALIKIGDKYKSWTVVGGPKLSDYGSQLYKVQCDCGTVKWTDSNRLLINTSAVYL